MKQWFALTCPVCGFRFPTKKFNSTMKPIRYPLQIVTGGGRAKGFKVVKYLPWSTLPTLRKTEVWTSILYLYNRLGAAYDRFYQVLGFLSPTMKTLLQQHRKTYADVYRTTPLTSYPQAYETESLPDIADAYPEDDYTESYALFFMNGKSE